MPKAKKHFGQHFLSSAWASRLYAHMLITQDSQVLEIGPGQGVFTRMLLTSSLQSLLAIEIDQDMVRILNRDIKDLRLQVLQQDILQYPLQLNDKSIVCGNLPYNIASKIILNLTAYYTQLQAGYFLVQKEVADRLCAQAGDRARNSLSIFVDCYFTVSTLEIVPACAFDPQPKVLSSFIHCKPRDASMYLKHIDDMQAFQNFLQILFHMPRKTVRNNLRPLLDANILNRLPYLDARPSALETMAVINLFKQLRPHLIS